MQRSRECWGADADTWNPDRWFADNIQDKQMKYWIVVNSLECLMLAITIHLLMFYSTVQDIILVLASI